MCRDPATTVTACGDSNGQTDGSGVLDTARVGTHTYRVTVTDAVGQTATRTITYTVAAAPTVAITSPLGGGVYTQGERVTTTYSCTADPATTLTACGDSNGGTGGAGVLDTASVGTHTYRVTVTDALGQTATRTITYTVAAQPIPPTPPTAPPPPAPARLVVRVGAPRIARAGRVVQVTVRVTNTGGSLAQAPARACTTIPAGTTATRFAGGRVTRNRVCWNLSTIRPATTRVFRLTLRASPTIRRARVITVTTTTPGRPPVRTRIRVLPAVHVPVTPRVTG